MIIMRNRFDIQLENLNNELITMGALCEEAVTSAVKGLFEENMALAQKAVNVESEIDQKERDIEALCMKLLLQQHPVAGDLRVISSALKMISDMERIGDQAEDIGEIVQYLDGQQIPQGENLKKMAQMSVAMLTQSIDSFVKKDLELAKKMILEDNIVDDYFYKVKEDLINIIAKTPEKGQMCLDLLMIAKYLERIADHATNIGEWVVYSITGEHPQEEN